MCQVAAIATANADQSDRPTQTGTAEQAVELILSVRSSRRHTQTLK